MLFLPESPRWLIKKSKPDAAAKSMSRLRRLPVDHFAVREELQEVQKSFEHEISTGNSSYAACFKGSIGKRLLVGCVLQALQQLSGINFIFYYGTNYFKNAGFQNDPFAIQMIITAVSIVSILPGLYAVDKFGRRPVLLTGSIGMSITQIIIAIVGTVIIDPDIGSPNPNLTAQKANICFVCFYVFFFEMSWGPCAWTVTGEVSILLLDCKRFAAHSTALQMFPLNFRAKCLSITTSANWLLNFIIAFCTPYLVDVDKANLQSKVFFLWTGFCIFSIFFVWAFIYETKNLTLEQVHELYETVDKAWKSKEFGQSLQRNTGLFEATSTGADLKGDENTFHTEDADEPFRIVQTEKQ